MIPGGEPHDIGQNTQWDRDVHNLMEDSEPWLRFDSQEEARGAAGLFQLGIPVGAPFVCLIVRDSAYLDSHMPNVEWSYHSFRDSSIQNYVLAAEELANRGYYVLRMGASVREAIPSNHPRVIDYAFNRMRSDFMDVYLGAKCRFCVSMGTGFDALPYIFRRPIVFVNSVPLGYLFTFSSRFIAITRHHVAVNGDRELTLGEITARDLGFCLNAAGFEKQGVKPLENSPDEIRDVVIEMDERLNGTWQAQEGDDDLQKRFWEMFPSNAARNGNPLHGEIRSRYGATFLRKNRWWLDLPADIGRGATASAAH